MVPVLIGEAQKASLTKTLPWRNLYLNLCKQILVKMHIQVSTGEGIGGISRPSVCTIPRGHFLQHYIVNGSPCSYAVYFFIVGQIRGGVSDLNFDGKGQGMTNRGNFMYRVMGTCETMVRWGPGITSLWLKLKMSWDGWEWLLRDELLRRTLFAILMFSDFIWI